MPVYDCGDPECVQCQIAFRTTPKPPKPPMTAGLATLIARLEALAEKAQHGPWRVEELGCREDPSRNYVSCAHGGIATTWGKYAELNAALIAACDPQTILLLCAALAAQAAPGAGDEPAPNEFADALWRLCAKSYPDWAQDHPDEWSAAEAEEALETHVEETCAEYERQLARLRTSAPAAVVPDGWQLVPVEPTQAMVDACGKLKLNRLLRGNGEKNRGIDAGIRDEWESMLATAPKAPPGGAAEEGASQQRGEAGGGDV